MFPRTLFFMLACACVGYLLGRSRGMGLQGFFLGLAFGPIGWGLVLLWPRSWIQGPVPRDRETGPQGRSRPQARNGGRQYAETSEGGSESAFGGAESPFGRGNAGPGARPGGGCPRCGSPVERKAGSCPRCGNVLVPIRYRVNPGGS
jgi:hypothetical protein